MQFLKEFVQISYFAIYLNHIYEVPLKLFAIVCPIKPKYFLVMSKEELKIGNRLSIFIVVRVVNTEIF